MVPGFERLIENRIRDAQKKGEFDNLEGSGEPLDIEDFSGVPEDLRLSYKMLKNAGYAPPEIQLKKDIKKTEDLLACLTDESEKYHAIKKLNFLVMKLNISRNTSIDQGMDQLYYNKLVENSS
jgi:hypothetical protein